VSPFINTAPVVRCDATSISFLAGPLGSSFLTFRFFRATGISKYSELNRQKASIECISPVSAQIELQKIDFVLEFGDTVGSK